MKKYTATHAMVINDTRYDKGATIELTDKAAQGLVAAGKIILKDTPSTVKSTAKNTTKAAE